MVAVWVFVKHDKKVCFGVLTGCVLSAMTKGMKNTPRPDTPQPPLDVNHTRLIQACGGTARNMHHTLTRCGLPSPGIKRMYQWLRPDRNRIPGDWLPLFMFVAVRLNRIENLTDLFIRQAPPQRKENEKEPSA